MLEGVEGISSGSSYITFRLMPVTMLLYIKSTNISSRVIGDCESVGMGNANVRSVMTLSSSVSLEAPWYNLTWNY